ncbi:MAG: hypothetical protein JNK63_02835 [Chthonomonas sp.]|nr:hypothetical protein [Chthonomonas sp.]
MKKGWKWTIGIGLVLLGTIGYLVGPEALSAYRSGFFDKEKKKLYAGDTVDNLRRLHTAMMLYHDSEGQFPYAAGWMDAIENRLQTNDLVKDEGKKKLHRPEFANSQVQYGYAMNDAAEAKYKDDLPKETELIFESKSTERNAHGDAKSGKTGTAITIEGKLIPAK